MDLVLPQLAQVVTVYEFLLMKVSLPSVSRGRTADLKLFRKTSFAFVLERAGPFGIVSLLQDRAEGSLLAPPVPTRPGLPEAARGPPCLF